MSSSFVYFGSSYYACHPPDIPSNPEIYATNPAFAKQSEYAVVTVLFLATKYGYDSQKLRNLLEQHGLVAAVLEEIVKVYDTNKKDLLINNLKIGHSLPHITDAEWRLTCDVKSSASDKGSGDLTYRISLGRYREKTGERESTVEFVCNPEELQSFIGRLKEIERHCEKISAPK